MTQEYKKTPEGAALQARYFINCIRFETEIKISEKLCAKKITLSRKNLYLAQKNRTFAPNNLINRLNYV